MFERGGRAGKDEESGAGELLGAFLLLCVCLSCIGVEWCLLDPGMGCYSLEAGWPPPPPHHHLPRIEARLLTLQLQLWDVVCETCSKHAVLGGSFMLSLVAASASKSNFRKYFELCV